MVEYLPGVCKALGFIPQDLRKTQESSLGLGRLEVSG